MKKCEKCGELLLYPEKHRCYEFEYRLEGDDVNDDWVSIWGSDFEDVALKIGEQYNDENDLIDDEIEVAIRKDGIEKRYSVSAHFSIDYRAVEI